METMIHMINRIHDEWKDVPAWRIKVDVERGCIILAKLGEETTSVAIRTDEPQLAWICEFIKERA